MKRILVALSLMACFQLAQAGLTIEITKGVDKPISIAIVPFSWSGAGYLSEDIANIVAADLGRSGEFSAMERKNMLSQPSRQQDVVFRDWRMSGVEYVAIGHIEPRADGVGYQVGYELYDVTGQKQVFVKSARGGSAQLRDLAHKVSDDIYEALTGYRGIFSTQIVFVKGTRNGRQQISQLWMADADGARERKLVESAEPIMSPTWSPDGKQVAYVSFETGRPAIYRQVLASGQREKLTGFTGLNGAPAWSPDGRRIAMVLSKDGNAEVYMLDLGSQQFTRVTNNPSIDTEPSWSPDGAALYFTSDRGGKPNIYRYTLASGKSDRVTFEGNYNARGRVTPDGKSLVMVHRESTAFNIAVQDLKSGILRNLTQTALDESPSIAPNGRMLMYATRSGNKGILAGVSIDGRIKENLPSQQGDVREPAWSPFLN